jgi:hypothetical protein
VAAVRHRARRVNGARAQPVADLGARESASSRSSTRGGRPSPPLLSDSISALVAGSRYSFKLHDLLARQRQPPHALADSREPAPPAPLVVLPPLSENRRGAGLRPLQGERFNSRRRVVTVAKDD